MIVIPVALTHYGVVAALQEVLCRNEPHVYHPLLEILEILRVPIFAIAHQLGGIGKLITDKGGYQ